MIEHFLLEENNLIATKKKVQIIYSFIIIGQGEGSLLLLFLF